MRSAGRSRRSSCLPGFTCASVGARHDASGGAGGNVRNEGERRGNDPPAGGGRCFFFSFFVAPSHRTNKKKKQAGARPPRPRSDHTRTPCVHATTGERDATPRTQTAGRTTPTQVNRPLRNRSARTDTLRAPASSCFPDRSTRLSSNKRPRDGRESGELPRELCWHRLGARPIRPATHTSHPKP